MIYYNLAIIKGCDIMLDFYLYLERILYMLITVSTMGYIFVVLKEKFHLSNNTIIIDKKAVTDDYLEEADIKVFGLGGENIKAGDEVRITMDGNKKVSGIIIGAKKKDNLLLLVTHDDKVEKLKVNKIKDFRVISKYGRFFK